MAEFLQDALRLKFAAAADSLPSLVPSLKQEKLLEFYALYKQATVGECNTPSPYWYAYESKRKWEAWKALGDLPQTEAMIKYISLIEEILPDWETNQKNDEKKEGWVAVSRMANDEIEINEEDKNIFDRVKEGDIGKVKSFVENCGVDITDEFGMSLLHWAADRGLLDMVKLLLAHGANIDMRDGSGQTALHYACSCGHSEIVEVLLLNGAQRNLVCDDGFTPYDLASEEIRTHFKSASFP